MPRSCRNWLETYLEYTAISETPAHMHLWVGVGTIAAVLRRRVWIDQFYFKWLPNFYIVLVAPPGTVAKSTAIGIAKDLLSQVPGLNFGPDSTTWQALMQEMAGITEHVRLEDGSYLPMSCVTLTISELGTLLDKDEPKAYDVLVDLWDGRPGITRKSTKTQGEDLIENPWINILAATTPTWIADNLQAIAITGGFISRCIFLYADAKRHFEAYPGLSVPKGHETLRAKLIGDLKHIAKTLKGPYSLTPEAVEWGRKWYEDLQAAAPTSTLRFDLKTSGYLERKQTHLHKLAMVLAASESDAMTITAEHLVRADAMLREVEEKLPKVFQRFQVRGSMNHAQDILDRIRARKTIEMSVLYREVFSALRLSEREFNTIIQSALKANLVKLKVAGPTRYLEITEEETP